jgi:cysteine desulfurase
MDRFIYLDYNATTPTDPRVVEAMLPYMTNWFANPSSKNYGLAAHSLTAVEKARQSIANGLQVDANEILFTSGATESLNFAIQGIASKYQSKGRHIISFKSEHRAVLEPLETLQRRGFEIDFCPLDNLGQPDLQYLEKAIRKDTIMVLAMWVNNETGVVFPMEEIGQICREAGVILLSDATQAIGKMEIYPKKTGVSALAFAGHKIFGPKGTGILYLSRKAPRIQVEPLLYGGGQEFGFRGGTLNVPGIVGTAAAFDLAFSERNERLKQAELCRKTLEKVLFESTSGIERTVPESMALPHVSHLLFTGVRSAQLLSAWYNKIGVSSGSACSSGDLDPSHVLLSMGLSREKAFAGIRLSFSHLNNVEESIAAASLMAGTYNSLKK